MKVGSYARLRQCTRGLALVAMGLASVAHAQSHTADVNTNNRLDLSEILRLIQFYNANHFQCAEGTEDGYAPGAGSDNCARHDADYHLLAFQIDLSELLRGIQLFNAGGYYACTGLNPPTEDNFCPGATPPYFVVTTANAFDVPEGETRTIAITLSAPPPTLTLVSASLTGPDPDFSIASGQSLAFDSATYDIPQFLVVAAAEDADAVSGTNTLRLKAAGVPEQFVLLSEVDNDTLALLVSPTTLVIDEGDSGSVSVSLTAAPEAPLTVTTRYVSGDTDLLAAVGTTRIFTPENFATPQTVSFVALEDDDETDGEATFSITALGVEPVSVVVTERDNDREVVILSTTSITVEEGLTNTFGVRLNVAPAAPRTITVAAQGGDPDLFVLTGMELTFDADNFAVEQIVEIAAAEDVDASNGQALFLVSGVEVGGATLTATELDNDQSNRISGSYTAVPLGSDNFAFLGFAPDVCALPAAPLTFSSGSAFTRTRGYELELGRRVALPALGTLGVFTAGNTTVHVQNGGAVPSTYALVALNAQGVPVFTDCSGVLQPGAQWQFDVPLAGDEAALPVSGVVYALQPDETNLGAGGDATRLCSTLLDDIAGDRQAFEDFESIHDNFIGTGKAGERAAVVVVRGRAGEIPEDAGAIRASYNGYSARMFKSPVGAVDPGADYVLSYLVAEGGLSSYIHVYNDSAAVANVSLTLTRLDGVTESTVSLVPVGANVTFDVATVFGNVFTGSGRVDSDVPVAVVADIVSASGAVAASRATRLDTPATRLQTPIAYDAAFEHVVHVTNNDVATAQIIVAFLNSKGETILVSNQNVDAGRTALVRLPAELLTEGLSRGLVIAQTNGASLAASLVRAQRDSVNAAPLQLDVVSMPGRATVIDSANGLATGAKVLFLPVFGQGAAAINSVLHISNANDASGQTAYTVYTYDSAGIHEYACGLIRAGGTDRITIPRDELGDGYVGAFVIAALASNQAGGPGLIATLGNDVAPLPVAMPSEPGDEPFDETVAVVTASTVAGTGKYGRGANIVHIPVLNDGAMPWFSIQNTANGEAQISIIYLGADGTPLDFENPLATTHVLPPGEAVVLSDDVPPDAASATVFAYAVADTTVEGLVAAAMTGGDSTAYRQLLARLETVSTGEVVVSVVRGAAAPESVSAYLGTGGRYLGVEDPVNRGFAYTLPEVRGDTTTLYVQNAGLAPVLLELSLRRAGEAASPVAPGPLNVEGGDLSRRVGPVPPGGVQIVQLGEVFGPFDTGRLVVRASEPLAITAEGAGDATAAFPVALNFTSNHSSAFAKVGGTVVYAPLVANPRDGATVTFALEDLLDLGTSKVSTARISYYTATGVKVGEENLALTPFESSSLTVGSPVNLGGAGWARVELVENPATNPAVIQGTLNVTEGDGAAYAYPLIPEEKGATLTQAIAGVSGTSILHVLNPANTTASVELTFYSGLQTEGEGEVDSELAVLMDIDPRNVLTLNVADITDLPVDFAGGVIIHQTLLNTTTPGVAVAATL